MFSSMMGATYLDAFLSNMVRAGVLGPGGSADPDPNGRQTLDAEDRGSPVRS